MGLTPGNVNAVNSFSSCAVLLVYNMFPLYKSREPGLHWHSFKLNSRLFWLQALLVLPLSSYIQTWITSVPWCFGAGLAWAWCRAGGSRWTRWVLIPTSYACSSHVLALDGRCPHALGKKTHPSFHEHHFQGTLLTHSPQMLRSAGKVSPHPWRDITHWYLGNEQAQGSHGDSSLPSHPTARAPHSLFRLQQNMFSTTF